MSTQKPEHRLMDLYMDTLRQIRNLTHGYLDLGLSREAAFLQIQRIIMLHENTLEGLKAEEASSAAKAKKEREAKHKG